MNGNAEIDCGGDVESILMVLDRQQLSHPYLVHSMSRLAAVSGVAEDECVRHLGHLKQRGLVRQIGEGVSARDVQAVLTEEGEAAASNLRVAAPKGPIPEYLGDLDDVENAVLNVVTEHEMRVADGSATRSQIRMSVRNLMPLALSVDRVHLAIDGICDTFLSRLPAAEAQYQVKLRGLVASRWGINVKDVLDRVLAGLRELQRRDPALRRYSWGFLRSSCDLPWKAHNLTCLAIARTGLSPSMYIAEGDYWWSTPKDLDLLIDVSSTFDFIDGILRSRNDEVVPGSSGRSAREVIAASAPRVFISYSHDGDAHAKWILRLAEDLREAGVDAMLDVWDLRPGQDVASFMEQGISGSHRVLMVCSKSYTQKADGGRGGVGYEKLIVTGEMVTNSSTDRFVPIVRGNPTKAMPVFLKGRLHIDFDDDSVYDDRLEQLIREIHQAPKNAKPPLGQNPFRRSSDESTQSPTTSRGEAVAPVASSEVGLSLDFVRKSTSTGKIHWYELIVTAKNLSRRRIDDWQIEVRFPTPLLDGTSTIEKLDSKSNDKESLFFLDGRHDETALIPDHEHTVRIGYHVTDDILWNRSGLFQELVRVRILVDGSLATEVEQPVGHLQNF